jgi:hypothetical protein
VVVQGCVVYFYIYIYGQKFPTNWFVGNFLQPTYKIDTCHLIMREAHVFLLILLKKYVRNTCYLNNMCFLHAKEHISILYVGCRKFLSYIYIYVFGKVIHVHHLNFLYIFIQLSFKFTIEFVGPM